MIFFSRLEAFQDFSTKLDMNPHQHLVEMCFFHSLAKIMKNFFEHLNFLVFKVIFQCGKLIESFQKEFFEE